MFDYITIIFIAILAIGALIGLARGGFKMISWIVIIVAAVLVGIFFSKMIADNLAGTDMGRGLNNTLFTFVASKINFEVGPYTITGNTEVTEAELQGFNAVGQAIHGADWTVLHEAYASVNLPTVFYQIVDNAINGMIASYNGEAFALAKPVAEVLTGSILYAGSFLSLFSATMLVGGILSAIIRAIIKSTGREKPSGLSRLLGGIAGFAIAGVVVWAVCLTFNFVMLMDNDASLYLKQVLHMTEGDTTWTFAKWLTSSDFGYNAIISFFIK